MAENTGSGVALGLRLLRREWRAGELRVLAIGLVVAADQNGNPGAVRDVS